MNKLIFKIFIVFSFCQGLLFYVGIPATIYKTIIVLLSCIILFFTIVIKRKTYALDILLIFYWLYVLTIIVSSYINSSSIKDAVSYTFYSLPGVITYMYIKRIKFSELELIKMNKLVFWIMISQIIASVFKLIIWGTSEAVVGTIHFSGGSLNTIVPLLGISMLISFYLIQSKSKVYLYLILGFMFMAAVGEKRGIYFYLIIVLAFSLYSHNFLINKVKASNIILFFVLFIPLSFFTLYFGARFAPTLNPENIIGGSFNPEFIYSYAVEYTTQTDMYGYANGRFSGLFTIFNTVIDGNLKSLFIGEGPGELLGKGDEASDTYYKYNLASMLGVNGWSTALISLGFIGAILVVIFYFIIGKFSFNFAKKEKDPYWKAIGFGTYILTFVFFLDFFTYTRSFYHSIPLNLGLLYFYGVLYKKNRFNKV